MIQRFNKLIYILFLLPLALFSNSVLVSIGAHRYFVEKIAGDTVSVQLIVPPGSSSHTYEPTPKQVVAASQADIWFLMGEPFEKRASESLKSFNPKMDFVDLRDGIDLIYGHQCGHHKHGSDLHTWLSPKNAKIQAGKIAQVLGARYPENRALYERNLQDFLVELDALERDVANELKDVKVIMVSHPAYGYLARDYGFEQISLECEGKDPTPKQLTMILEEAKEHRINTIFAQEQLSMKGARLVADTIGGRLVILDPYAEDYSENLREIAKAFHDSNR